MAITLNAINSTVNKNTGGTALTTNIAVTLTGVAAGDLITVQLGVDETNTVGTVTVTDNVNSGNYSVGNAMYSNPSWFIDAGTFYFVNSAAGTVTITASWTGSEAYASIFAQSWKGAATSGVLDAAMTKQQYYATATANPVSNATTVAPTNAGELIIGFSTSGSNLPTAGTSYTSPATTLYEDTTNFMRLEYWIQTTATATNTPFVGASDNYLNQMTGFIASGGAGPVTPLGLLCCMGCGAS
jgi:hypothetical protein